MNINEIYNCNYENTADYCNLMFNIPISQSHTYITKIDFKRCTFQRHIIIPPIFVLPAP